MKTKNIKLPMAMPAKMPAVRIGSVPSFKEAYGRALTGIAQVRETTGHEQLGERGEVVQDWGLFWKLHEEDPQAAAAFFLSAAQSYCRAADFARAGIAKRFATARELAVKGDFPDEIVDVIDTYHIGQEEQDVGWREIYKVRDFRNGTASSWKIREATHGISFRTVPSGDSVDVYGLSANETEVTMDRYGGAFGFDRTWWEDQDWYAVEESVRAFRLTYAKQQATVFYGLIEAVTGQSLAWQAHPDGVASGTAGYQVGRDVETMNTARRTIISDLKAAGQDVTLTSNTRFKVLAPIELQGRMDRAINADYGLSTATGLTQLVGQFDPIYTTNLASAATYYVILPERQIQAGERQDLTLFTEFDILSYSDTTAGWGRFGGGIGEDNQIQVCATA